jgi:hypothetical protein
MPSTLSAVARLFALLAGVVLACALTASAVAHRAPRLQHVTIFGDSSASVFEWDPPARAAVEKGNRVTYELQPCGRLTTPGCINPPPPSVLSEVRAMGRSIGPTAIVLVGYNDDPHVYANGIDSVLRAMHRNGVKQVLWLTLRTAAHAQQYGATNGVIRSARGKFPFMTVVNWAGYSAPHSNWFTDGIHFTGAGGVEFGKYLHRTLQSYGLAGPQRSSG